MSWTKRVLFTMMVVAAYTRGEDVDVEVVEAPDKLPAPPPSPLDDCDPELIGFELITGYVFSAPGNVLDSIPGTLMLTDCLETCQGNDSCQSVNYETGLCILFSSNADVLPGESRKRKLLGLHTRVTAVGCGGSVSTRSKGKVELISNQLYQRKKASKPTLISQKKNFFLIILQSTYS
jgi:hypothetical protein